MSIRTASHSSARLPHAAGAAAVLGALGLCGCSSQQPTQAPLDDSSISGPRSCIGPAYSADSMDAVVGGYYDPRVIPSQQIVEAQQRQIASMQAQAYAQARANMMAGGGESMFAQNASSATDMAAYNQWLQSQGYR